MSAPEIERFAKDVRGNSALQEDLRSVGSNVQSVVAIANGKGYAFTQEELESYVQQHAPAKNGRITDEQLEKVSGGFILVICVLAVLVEISES